MCVDGSVNHCPFAEDTLREKLLMSSGKIVVVNCMSWPGYRGAPPTATAGRISLSSIARSYGEQLYAHALETLFKDTICPPIVYKDGLFEVFINNKNGKCKQVGAGDSYNLHVVFVAPTEQQFLACGGMHSIGDLQYGKGYPKVADMVQIGKQMGQQFVQWHGDISFI